MPKVMTPFNEAARADPDNNPEAVEAAGGDPSGWHVPLWSVKSSEASMARNGATTAILSLTSPGAPIAGSQEGARKIARQANEVCAQMRDDGPSRFGFFAAMPDLLDTEGTISEIEFASTRSRQTE